MPSFSFLPREQKFFNLFEDSAANIVKAAQALRELVNNWNSAGTIVAEITEMEHEGDSITHQIQAQLNRTFITPFDREDISLLSHSMDDIVDFIHAAADAMFIYKIEEPTPRSKELADIIVQGANEVEKAVKLLRKQKLKNIYEPCVEINRLENTADRVYRAGMAELFDQQKDFAYVIKWREIYEHMESATDRCEDVANVLEGVALKHA